MKLLPTTASAVLVALSMAPTTVAQGLQDCSALKNLLDTCVSSGLGGAQTSCEACVGSLLPLNMNCASMRAAACGAVQSCSCGYCHNRILEYWSCMTGYCTLGPCPSPNTPVTGPIVTPPTVVGGYCYTRSNPTLGFCGSQFSSISLSGCADATNLRNQCAASCNHPGCSCSFSSGMCGFSNHFLSCVGTPTPCNQITDWNSCLQAQGCYWELLINPEPSPGWCTGGGISSCQQGFPTRTCSACNTNDPACTAAWNACTSSCNAHPGCTCDVNGGTCQPPYYTGNHQIRCKGTPLACSQITDWNLCNSAINCQWTTVPPFVPIPTPTFQTEGEGVCVGQSSNSCAAKFPAAQCSACGNDANCMSVYNSCVGNCNTPGCKCEVTYGQCSGGVGNNFFHCVGTPLPCRSITSASDCNVSPGCIWAPLQQRSQPAPVPIPTPIFQTEGEGDGTCVGQAITSCSSEFLAQACPACGDGAEECALSWVDSCELACNHPGCACDIQYGQCSGASEGQNIFRCAGNPLPCSQITSRTACRLANGCTWTV